MIRLVNLVKIDKGVNRRSKGAIQPPSSLSDKLRCGLRDVRLGFTGLDICECPFLMLLCDELEAQDPIFGCGFEKKKKMVRLVKEV